MSNRLWLGSCIELLNDTLFAGANIQDTTSWFLSLPFTDNEVMGGGYNFKYKCKTINGSICLDIPKADGSKYRSEDSSINIPGNIMKFFRGDADNGSQDRWVNNYADNSRETRLNIAIARLIIAFDAAASDTILIEATEKLFDLAMNDAIISTTIKARFGMLHKQINNNRSRAIFMCEVFFYAAIIKKKDLNASESCLNNIPNNCAYYIDRKISKKIENCISQKYRIITISGLSGVGKTQIARYFANCHKSSYDIIWEIDGSSEETIIDSYREFLSYGRQSGIATRNHSLKTETDSEFSDDVSYNSSIRLSFRNYFENTKKTWLLMYRNCVFNYSQYEDGHKLDAYLPSCGNGSIILTTILSDSFDDTIVPIRVKPFTLQESRRLLKNITKQKPDDNADLLISKIGGLPLAISSAGAYIKANNLSGYADYLKLYSKYGTSILNTSDDCSFDNAFANTYLLNLKSLFNAILDRKEYITICAILSFCVFSSLSGLNLEVFSFSNTQNIKEIGRFLNNDIFKNHILHRLRMYSIIEIDNSGFLIMHPLQKQVIREYMTRNMDDISEMLTGKRTNLAWAIPHEYLTSYLAMKLSHLEGLIRDQTKYNEENRQQYIERASLKEYEHELLSMLYEQKRELTADENSEELIKLKMRLTDSEVWRYVYLACAASLNGDVDTLIMNIKLIECRVRDKELYNRLLPELLHLYNYTQKNILAISPQLAVEYQKRTVAIAKDVFDRYTHAVWPSFFQGYSDLLSFVVPFLESIRVLVEFDYSESGIYEYAEALGKHYRHVSYLFQTADDKDNNRYNAASTALIAFDSLVLTIFEALPENMKSIWIKETSKHAGKDDFLDHIYITFPKDEKVGFYRLELQRF